MVIAIALTVLMAGSQPQSTQGPFRIYFLGNSHTSVNDVPGLVRSLLASGGVKVETEMAIGGQFDDIERDPRIRNRIAMGKWTHVVLQGASISSSHKYEYSQAGGIALVKRVVAAKAKPLLFAEWPRKGWDESDYIYEHYEIIKRDAGGETLPICYAWDRAVKEHRGLNPWATDGNHAALAGSYIAACTIANWIAGTDATLTFVPRGLEAGLASKLRQTARQTVTEWRKKLAGRD